MANLFNLILYRPLFNALIYLYHIIPGHDLGIAIIVLTVLIKLLLFAPSYSSIKATSSMQALQPKLDAIKKQYKDNREEQGRQLMKLYKEHRVNPLSSCLPLLVQLPIIWALYRVFYAGIKLDPSTGFLTADQLQHLYGWLRDLYSHTQINTIFLGFVDLAKNKNFVLAFLSAAATFWQSKMLMPKRQPKIPGAKDENLMASTSRQMTYFFPLIVFYFGMVFPAGLTLYWFASTLFQIAQQYYFLRRQKPKPAPNENLQSPIK